MSLPAWDDPQVSAGTMIRGALWLVQVVGEGNTFTKTALRQAFPEISQADRRLRDLRDYGWVILTNTEDASLSAEDQRFVKAGVPVWNPAARRAAARESGPTPRERQAILARDDYICTLCGLAGGEAYSDGSGQTAVLTVSRVETVMADGSKETLLSTLCRECRAGTPRRVERESDVLDAIQSLDEGDQARIFRWMTRGRRTVTPVERAWSRYLRLPAAARDKVRSDLMK